MSWSIEPLTAAHDVKSFSCGEVPLNRWLVVNALTNERRNISRTRVLVHPGEPKVLGFYCLSSATVVPTDIPGSLEEKLPQRYPIPCILLGQLAIDKDLQGQGLGRSLIAHAMRSCLRIADELGAYALTVHALHNRAAAFYAKYGFVPLLDDPLHMYMQMPVIRKIVVTYDVP